MNARTGIRANDLNCLNNYALYQQSCGKRGSSAPPQTRTSWTAKLKLSMARRERARSIQYRVTSSGAWTILATEGPYRRDVLDAPTAKNNITSRCGHPEDDTPVDRASDWPSSNTAVTPSTRPLRTGVCRECRGTPLRKSAQLASLNSTQTARGGDGYGCTEARHKQQGPVRRRGWIYFGKDLRM